MPEMYKVYQNTKKYNPTMLAALDDSDNIIALLNSVTMKEITGQFESITARSIIQGGPLFTNKTAFLELMQNYDELIKKKAIYTQIRNQWDVADIRNTMEKIGYDYIEYFNAVIYLNRPIEILWDNIKRDKRRGIQDAEKRGITIEKCENKSEIKVFYELLVDTYNNAKIPIPDISLFESVFDILVPVKKALFLFANYKNKPIATQLALMDNKAIYAWYTGANRDSLKYHPGDLLIWYLLKYGAENGFEKFDFGGGGARNKNTNLRMYKSRFGTKFQCYGRYEKTHSFLKRKFAETAFEIYRKIS